MTTLVEIIDQGDKLFSDRAPLLSLWQDIAMNFYPERADFTYQRSMGSDFADNLTTSYPILARRDLGNSFGALLRPRDREWFQVTVSREDRLDNAGRAWLQRATQTQRRAMYARPAQFIKATREADHDFASFGQTVLTCELNAARDDLLHRCWHLRDVVWSEDAEGKVCAVHRKWKPSARDIVKLFKRTGKVHQSITTAAEKEPYRAFELRHVVMRSEDYDSPVGGKRWRTPWVSLFIDVENKVAIEEVGLFNQMYVIPRWQTVSGSQYAYSPATVAALPDARLIQAMTLTLLEAGEKAANPPMVAIKGALRSDVNLYSGGITWADMEYDERLGEVLRPISQDFRGMPMGREMRNDTREMILEAFFLNKLTLPPVTESKDMTAYETGQRVQEYVRQALPLFEPMEIEYNGATCETDFDILLRAGAFGPMAEMPDSIRGQEIQFRFESPLSQAIERKQVGVFMETKALLAQVVDLDPQSARIIKAREALRDALNAIGTPARWQRDDDELEAMEQADKAKQAGAEVLAGLGAGANVAKTIGEAGSALREGLGSPAPSVGGAAA